MGAERTPQTLYNSSTTSPAAGHQPARYTLAQASNFLPITALLYDTWRQRSLSLLTHQAFPLSRELGLLLEWLGPTSNQRYLDVGTSTGNYARALADAGAEVSAIDISAPMLERARQRHAGSPIAFAQANIETVAYPDASFDGISVGASLNEFRNTNLALEQMARVLKPGGKLFLMYLCRASSPLGRLTQWPFAVIGVRFPERRAINAKLAASGLKLRRSQSHRAVTFELFVKGPFKQATVSQAQLQTPTSHLS